MIMAKKEMTIVELKDKLGKLNEERQGIFDALKKETRKANENEEKRLGEIASEVAELEFDIKLAEARNRQKPVKTFKPQTNGNLLLRAIRSAVTGESSDEVEALIEAGKTEMRAIGMSAGGNLVIPMEYRGDIVAAGLANDGKEVIAEDLMGIIGPIRESLVLTRAGANFITGLVGNVGLPEYSGSSVAWAGETAKASNGKGTFSKKILTPKRLTAFVDISKQFILQDSVGANALLQRDMALAIATVLNATAFGKHATSQEKPDGFFTGTPTYAAQGTASLSNMVALETAVNTDNAIMDNLAYITSKKGMGILKTTLNAANVAEGFIYKDGKANGMNTYVTVGMANGLQTDTDEEGIVFGNWADYVIGQWGSLDITVDPYTKAADGQVRLVINSFFDMKARRDDSFAIGSLK